MLPLFTLALLVAVDDPAARQIVGRQFHGDFISRQTADEILAHLPGDVRQYLVLVLQLDAEHSIRPRLDDRGPDFGGRLFWLGAVARFFFFIVLCAVPRPRLPARTRP